MAYSDFQRMVKSDLQDTFLNLDEFAERHNVGTKCITCVLDSDTLIQRQDNTLNQDIADSDLLLFAKVSDLPKRQPAGQTINVDGKQYIITDWKEDMGLAELTLASHLSM